MRALALALLAGAAVRVAPPGSAAAVGRSPAVTTRSPQGYLIPYDPSVVGQWNAFDIFNATSRVGPPWTKIGAPTLSYGGPTLPASVGGFSDSNYFSLAAGSKNPMSPASPFCLFIIATPVSLPNTGPTLVGAGNFSATGYEFTLVTPSDELRWVNDAASLQLFTTNTVTSSLSSPHVLMAGVGGGSNFVQLDNVALASQSGAFSQNTTLAVFLGRNTPTTFPWGGTITEVQMRAPCTPSQAIFSAVYNTVRAQLP